MTDLLKKDKSFIWEPAQQQAFDNLRTYLMKDPILQYSNFNEPFNLTTDASGYAIGGILSQGPLGNDLPIAYTSRTLNSAEQKYSTIEKECLAIIYSINHFRPYLYGRKFKIVTEHKPLVWLNSIKGPSTRLWKWRTKLAEYKFEIYYKKNSLNSNADALSRNPPTEVNTIVTPTSIISSDSSDEPLFPYPPSITNIDDNAVMTPPITRNT